MPVDHNDHYHRMLLRKLPKHGRVALDVGCGTGGFARRMAARGYEVDAVDPSAEVIAVARQIGGGPRFRRTDVASAALPKGHYDVITCLASLHHMPFGTVTRFREALAPGGVLLVLGCYAGITWWDLAAVPPMPWHGRGWRWVSGCAEAEPCPRGRRCASRGCRWRTSGARRTGCCPAPASANSSTGVIC
jgi:SAM-dependent methyltransferase